MFKNRINHQAEAVKAYLSARDGIEPSWDSEFKRYMARPEIAQWHNCRERGYVVTLYNNQDQINIAFFEHRNSDAICAVMWHQHTLNPPTIDNAEFGDVYNDKWGVSHSVGYGQVTQMADWIYDQLETFWLQSSES